MSGPLEDSIKRWTDKRKSALVVEILQGKTTVAGVSRTYDLSPSEIEGWMEDARKGMENVLTANPPAVVHFNAIETDQQAQAVAQITLKSVQQMGSSSFITPHCPQQNGMIERAIKTLKEQCLHRQLFDGIQHATRAIGDGISFYNHRRPHRALDMKTPAEAFALAA
jgi:transposase-like protein